MKKCGSYAWWRLKQRRKPDGSNRFIRLSWRRAVNTGYSILCSCEKWEARERAPEGIIYLYDEEYRSVFVFYSVLRVARFRLRTPWQNKGLRPFAPEIYGLV